jgi:hypothetical protein
MRALIRMLPAAVLVLCCAAPASSQSGRPGPRKTAPGKKEAAVSLTLEQVAQRAAATLSASEKPASVVYLDSDEIKAGASVPAGRETLTAPWDSYLAFVDLQPTANWGHSCRYLLVNAQTGDTKSFDASFPPFLKSGPSKTLRVVWKGERVPDWALAVRQQ